MKVKHTRSVALVLDGREANLLRQIATELYAKNAQVKHSSVSYDSERQQLFEDLCDCLNPEIDELDTDEPG